MKNHHIIMREPRTVEELDVLLRLRKKVAMAEPYRKLYENYEDDYALDHWDSRSIHLGLFLRDNDGNELPIGYQRGVGQCIQNSTLLDTFIKIHNEYFEIMYRFPQTTYPTQSWTPQTNSKAVNSFIHQAHSEELSIMESTRISILQSYQGRIMGRFFIDGIITYYFLYRKVDIGIMTVATHHANYYKAIGFKECPGTQSMFYDKVGQDSVALCISIDNVHPKMRNRLKWYAEQYSVNNEIDFQLKPTKVFASESISKEKAQRHA